MSGYESDTCGRSYTIRIRYVWTQIFLYPHKKFADTKISGYVWTGPNSTSCPQHLPNREKTCDVTKILICDIIIG